MFKPKKQVKGLEDELDELVKSLLHNAKIYNHLKRKVLEKYKVYICDCRRGFAYYDDKVIIIPKWSYNDKRDGYFIYYLAHELAHAINDINGTNDLHGSNFYKFFKKICPKEYQYYEIEYKPRNAKNFGIK